METVPIQEEVILTDRTAKSEIAEALADVLELAQKRDPTNQGDSKALPGPDLSEHLRVSLRKALERLDRIKPDTDLAFIELVRPAMPTPEDLAPPQVATQAWVRRGAFEDWKELEEKINESYTPGQTYSFLNWRQDRFLRLQVFRDESACRDAIARMKPAKARSTVVTCNQAIEDAVQVPRADQIEELRRSPLFRVFGGTSSDNSEMFERDAAQLVLRSTKITVWILEQDGSGRELKERNVLFLPVYAGGEVIGGAVIHSSKRFEWYEVPIFDAAFRLLLFPLRARDDRAANEMKTMAVARWETAMLYTHRLDHDIKKPVRALREILESILKERSLEIGRASCRERV